MLLHVQNDWMVAQPADHVPVVNVPSGNGLVFMVTWAVESQPVGGESHLWQRTPLRHVAQGSVIRMGRQKRAPTPRMKIGVELNGSQRVPRRACTPYSGDRAGGGYIEGW